VYLRFEELGFDSDQAIVGLMAEHLARGRAFPLFFYGQTYMLGVESWVAAPFVLVGGPTVAALRLSVLAWNLAFALLLLTGLQRDPGSQPWTAFAAALFFVAAPGSVAAQLMASQGGIIEPFVYIAILWYLRHRPIWFGIVLAIGFRNREFTMYAVPVLLFIEALTRELTSRRVRDWLIAMAMFFAGIEAIQALVPYADLLGPGTRGQLVARGSGSQLTDLMGRFDWDLHALPDRIYRIGAQLLAWLSGAAQIDSGLPISERQWISWIAASGFLLITLRLLVLMSPLNASTGKRSSFSSSIRHAILSAPFAFYILGVGVVATATFIAGKPVLHGYSRYALLGLLIPIGLTAAIVALEPRRTVAALVAASAIAWGALAVTDHVRILVHYRDHPPPKNARQVADLLVAEHIPVASAGYWQAYLITFLSGERVRVASTDFVRIQEYQDLLNARHGDVVAISDRPCEHGERVGDWYLCRP
jgi:hypothetical protein